MRIIYKFQLEITDEQEVSIPEDSKILSVALQDSRICLWVLCDPETESYKKKIYMFGTGNPIYDVCTPFELIGTVVSGRFVWHVFH